MTEKALHYDNILMEQVSLPYDSERTYLATRFSGEDVLSQHPILSGYQAIVIADTQPTDSSVAPISTVIARFPRVVLAELNTHRVFSRNSASSRARSIRSTIEAVLSDPYIPMWTQNQPGMSGKFLTDVDKIEQADSIWLSARDSAVDSVLHLLLGSLYDSSKSHSELVDLYYEKVYRKEDTGALSLHKQNVNRLLEPFMWHEVVITSNDWDNFFWLRSNLETADPAIAAISRLIEVALGNSVPVERDAHIPFLTTEEESAIAFDFEKDYDLLMKSASECAGISYHDKSSVTTAKGSASLGHKILASRHYSPFEHQAYLRGTLNPDWVQAVTNGSIETSGGNLGSEWHQLRHLVAHA